MKRVCHVRVGSIGLVGALVALAFSGCQKVEAPRLQGYVEGEFVYIAAPVSGALQTLSVQRGDQVSRGAPLFVLEHGLEKAAEDEAERRLHQAQAQLEDMRKGLRPAEVEGIEAQLKQARIASEFSEKEFVREQDLAKTGANTTQELDRARSGLDEDRQRVAQLQSQLTTASLGARADQIAAAEANVKALDATLAKAVWSLTQKNQNAPQAGVVFDTLYRPGEWVAAGRPVVALLPPGNRKVRTFVPQFQVGTIQVGRAVRVRVDGVAEPYPGKVSFISPQAEYTPPVIYSRESREKLVFMIEIVFEPTVGASLHPGQPVDVELN
jgi:HlyD family secretion protein